jgi:hypothetical protein
MRQKAFFVWMRISWMIGQDVVEAAQPDAQALC